MKISAKDNRLNRKFGITGDQYGYLLDHEQGGFHYFVWYKTEEEVIWCKIESSLVNQFFDMEDDVIHPFPDHLEIAWETFPF